jgi:hypothetical protein
VDSQERKLRSFFLRRAQASREEYEVDFRTSRPVQDGTNRTVTIAVAGRGKGFRSYQAPGFMTAEFDLSALLVCSLVLFLCFKVVPYWMWHRHGR